MPTVQGTMAGSLIYPTTTATGIPTVNGTMVGTLVFTQTQIGEPTIVVGHATLLPSPHSANLLP